MTWPLLWLYVVAEGMIDLKSGSLSGRTVRNVRRANSKEIEVEICLAVRINQSVETRPGAKAIRLPGGFPRRKEEISGFKHWE